MSGVPCNCERDWSIHFDVLICCFADRFMLRLQKLSSLFTQRRMAAQGGYSGINVIVGRGGGGGDVFFWV